jgi:mannosyltransferase OCH1-like enzyme
MSDFIRIALLKKYGGVWLDSSVTLFQSIDDWCMNKIENK